MDLLSLAVVGTSGTLAYLNKRNKIGTTPHNVEKFSNKNTDPTAQKSEDFLKVRLSTMLQEGTLEDVKAVLFQIEDLGLQDKIPDYKRAQNIIKSAVNPCGKPQVVHLPTRYQNQSMGDFTHNNFVPYFKGRNTQNMIGTGVPSGNWTSNNTGSNITTLNMHTGNDEFVKPPKNSRNPENRVFSVKELGTDDVWGMPMRRPELDRYVDTTNSKPDLAPAEKIKIGKGLDVPYDKNVGNRGFHEIYRPLEDAKRTINSIKKDPLAAPKPNPGGFVAGGKVSVSNEIPFSGGLRPAQEEGFSQKGTTDYQGNSFVVNRCFNQKAVDWEQVANSAPAPRQTGEYSTEQFLRGETNRQNTELPNDKHHPGLKTSRVKRHMNIKDDLNDQDIFDQNIKNFNTAYNREKTTQLANIKGIGTKIPGHDSGPSQYYVNETYKDHKQTTIRNISGSAGVLGALRQSVSVSDTAAPTNRQTYEEKQIGLGLYGAVGERGHKSQVDDEFKHTHRETTSTSGINPSGRIVPNVKSYDYQESQRNNIRYDTLTEDRPLMAHSNVMAPVKVRVGSFKLNDLRSTTEVSDRPNANTANTQNTWKFGVTTVSDKKIVESYSDPRMGLNLNMAYGAKPGDSKIDCRSDVNVSEQV